MDDENNPIKNMLFCERKKRRFSKKNEFPILQSNLNINAVL